MQTVEIDVEAREESEEARVLAWRTAALRRAGYGESAAAELACSRDVDLHRAVDLVRIGCPPETARRILA